MTQKFDEKGMVVPVTRLVAGPCVVTQLKAVTSDGYAAVQIGFGSKKKIPRSLQGHLKNLANFRYLKEFRITADNSALSKGSKLTVKNFTVADLVDVTGVSKGRGFQGVVKRHGFHGSPASHGHKDQLRMPGSIAAGGPQHVFKGTRMAGRMGGDQVTVKNLKIVEINPETNEIFIRGAVPGARGGLVFLTGAGEMAVELESAPAAEVPEVKTEAKAEAAVAEKPADGQEENKEAVKA